MIFIHDLFQEVINIHRGCFGGCAFCTISAHQGDVYKRQGGSVYAGLGIYDTMQFISSDVATICTGMAASMAAVRCV